MLQQSYIIKQDPASEWGELFQPLKSRERNGGLRIVLMGSTTAGKLVLDTLLRFAGNHPGKTDLIAMATDNTRDPQARIGIKKRIWKHYMREDRETLMEMVIQGALARGIPCYTGAVKNDYFKGLLREWDPEMIIMCCFGQKVDRFIYEYPRYGMYNFHPSDLASNIGAGARPYESTVLKGRTTSHMILHRVVEIIDGGPIIGISPRINISLAKGGYPDNFLVLQEKIPSICGWMTYGLLLAILGQKEKGMDGPVGKIDYEVLIPEGIKKMLMEPVKNDPSLIKKLPYPE